MPEIGRVNPATLVAILADVTGIAGAAMRGTDGVVVRGTDNALLAANYLGLTFVPYSYGPTELAHGANYVPANKTLVFTVELEDVIDAASELYFWGSQEGKVMVDAYYQNNSNNCYGMEGTFYCDGTAAFRNATGAASDLTLKGVTLT